MKKALVSLGLAGLLLIIPVIPAYAQHKPAEQTTLEYKIEKTFPDKEIKDVKDFRQYSNDIMKIVAEQMHIKLDESIPKPKITTTKDFTQEEFNKRLGYDFTAMCPVYFDKENEILLLEDSKLHSLAHELVHYFQIKYRQEDPFNDPYDNLEREAIYIQLEFKDKYLK